MNFFPATESTLSAHHLATFLQEAYGLSTKTSAKLIRTGMNHLYLVQDGNKQFVYRIYSYNWRSKTEIEEELRLLNHLEQNEIAISYPIKKLNSHFIEEFSAIEGLRFGVLFSFLEGKKNPYFDEKASHAVGELMANMHQHLEGFELKRVTYNAEKLFQTSLERTKVFFPKPSEEMTFLENTSSKLREIYANADHGKLRSGALHLDVWFDNMHFDSKGKPSLFDFDFCGNGWLIHDIGYFLYQLLYTNPDKELFEAKRNAFITGYESVRLLTVEEKQLIPYCGTAVLLFYISVQCDTFDTWSNVFLNEEHLKRYTGAMKRWVEYQGLSI